MNRHLASLLPFAVAIAASSPAWAQFDRRNRQSPTTGLAVAVSLPELANGNKDETLIGEQSPPSSSAPQAWSQSTSPYMPDHTLSGMFGTDIASRIQIDAMSSGNEILPPFDADTGSFDLSKTWLGIIVSVTDASTGRPGSFINERTLLPSSRRRTPGADIYWYGFQGSKGIDKSALGTLMERTSEQIGWSGAASTEDIDAVDLAIGVQARAGATLPSTLFSMTGSFYFSMTNASAGVINTFLQTNSKPKFAAGPSGPVEANGASVYLISWSPTTGWTPPSLVFDRATLGLTAELDDLDALALEPGGPLLFSARYYPSQPNGRSQMLVYDPQSDTLMNLEDGGAAVADLIGVDDLDDIDAMCGVDPESTELASHMGIPVDRMVIPGFADAAMSVFLTRFRPQNSQLDWLAMGATGFGVDAGNPNPLPGFTEFYVAIYDVTKPWTDATWFLLTSVPRPAGGEIAEFELPISPTWTFDLGVLAVQRDITWTITAVSQVTVIDL